MKRRGNGSPPTPLSGVSKTLTVTLAGRYYESMQANPIFIDPKSLELVHRLGISVPNLEREVFLRYVIVSRTALFDEQVKQVLDAEPHCTVVNLGAGLCSRFFRLDNGAVRWIDVDLPQVEPLWRRAFQPTERHQFVASSALEVDWMAKMGPTVQGTVLVVAEGLLMYLPLWEVQELLQALALHFPKLVLLADFVSDFAARASVWNPQLRRAGVRFHWGVRQPADLQRWGLDLVLERQWNVVSHHSGRLNLWRRWVARTPFFARQVMMGRFRLAKQP